MRDEKRSKAQLIEDDGMGPPEDVPSDHGMGLHTMAYRTQAIGNSLHIGAPDTGGTTVTGIIPVHSVNVTESLSHEP